MRPAALARPMPRTIVPTWAMLEKANRRLASVWKMALADPASIPATASVAMAAPKGRAMKAKSAPKIMTKRSNR